jgi:cysteine-rich repeat protein
MVKRARMLRLAWFAAIFVAFALACIGCLGKGANECAGGIVCPADKACVIGGGCAAPEQIAACTGHADGDACGFGREVGKCVGGVCIGSLCGNGMPDPGEVCDDGNNNSGDGCRSDCLKIEVCGDGVIDLGEGCDNGAANADVPDAPCRTTCQLPHCGDGIVDTGEQCDGTWTLPDTCLDYGFDAGSMGCSGLCRASLAGCGAIGWKSEALPPVVSGVNAVGGSGPSDVWAAGYGGASGQPSFPLLAHFNGQTWKAVPVPTGNFAQSLFGLWARASGDVWATGGVGGFHFDGAQWTTGGCAGRYVWSSSASDVWFAQTAMTHFDGSTCTDVATPLSVGGGFGGVHGTASNDVWSVASTGASPPYAVLRYDGTAWTTAYPSSIVLDAVWANGPHDVYSVGTSPLIGGGTPTIVHYDGTSWTSRLLGAPETLSGVWGSGPTDVWAVGRASGDGTRFFHYDGVTWNATVPPLPTQGTVLASPMITPVWGSGPGDVWTSRTTNGIDPHILHYRGSSWTPRVPAGGSSTTTTSTGFNLVSAWGSSATDVWVGGNDATAGGPVLFHSMGVFFDAGAPWIDTTLYGSPIVGLWGADASDVWAVSADAAFHYDGATWTNAGPGGSAIWGSGPSNVWIIGLDAALSQFDGSTWTPVTTPTTSALVALWGSGPSDIFVVGAAGAIVHYDGATWTAMTSNTTENLTAVWGTEPDDVWAVGNAGAILHYDGTTWTARPSMPLPLVAIHGTGPADVWAIDTSGTALHFDGVGWGPVRSLVDGNGLVPVLANLWGTPRHTFFVGNSGFNEDLDRVVPWSCQPTEVDCGDGVDNDCDGKIDSQDPDCAGAVGLTEISGSTPRYIEVKNRSARTANLSGISVSWRFACDSAVRSYTFMPDSIAAAGKPFRIVDDRIDVRARERYVGQAACETPTDGGWVALCSGPCDLVHCSNLLDYVVMSGGTTPPTPPTCASFTPTALGVSAATAGQSATRVSFGGGGSSGVTSDWAVQAVTRD